MSEIKDVVGNDETLKSEIGKFTIYQKEGYPKGKEFKFSSSFEEIGKSWDTSLRNEDKVLVLSDPVEVVTEKYGKIFLTKIFCATVMWTPNIMWVPSQELFITEE